MAGPDIARLLARSSRSIWNSVGAGLAVLLFLDPGQDLAQALVLDNGGMTNALQLVEGRIRQRPAFPANLQPPIRKVIDLDHFAAKANCQTFGLKRQLHATVGAPLLQAALSRCTGHHHLSDVAPGFSVYWLSDRRILIDHLRGR